MRRRPPVAECVLRAAAFVHGPDGCIVLKLLHASFLALVSAALLSLTAAARAEPATIRTQVIGGLVVVRGEIRGDGGTIQSNFILDLGSSRGLILPPDRAAELGLKLTQPVVIRLGENELQHVPVTEAEAAELIRAFTANHADALQQVPVAGLIGLGAFADRSVRLDLSAQRLELDVEPEAGGTTLVLEPGDRPTFQIGDLRIGLSMLQHESLISSRLVESLRIGQPDAATIRLGDVDLLQSDAFRPVSLGDDASPDLLLGVRLLGTLRTTFDAQRNSISIDSLGAATPQPAEQAYFLASHANDEASIARFVKDHPSSRLAGEAAMQLLGARANAQTFSADALREAVELVAASFPVDRRSHRLVQLVDQLLEQPSPRSNAIIEAMLSVADRDAEKDLDARATHEIHARRGVIALRAGDHAAARGHLISAAYGMSSDVQVNTWLGDLYRATGQPLRAWSRYVDVALAGRPYPPALRGLDELCASDTFRNEVTTADMALMLEGKVPAFVPRQPRVASDVPTARLVELFVDDSGAGNVGPELAFHGLQQNYAGAAIQFLAFHFGPAGNTDLSGRRASYYGVNSLPSVLADGALWSAAPSAADAAETVFNDHAARLRQADPNSTTRPAPALSADAAWNGEALNVEVSLSNAAVSTSTELHLTAFLVEKRVFALGGNEMAMHGAVARAVIGPDEGLVVPSASDRGRYTLSLSKDRFLEEAVTRAEQARLRRATLVPSMRTTRVNLSECEVIVVLEDRTARRVIASCLTTPTGEAEWTP